MFSIYVHIPFCVQKCLYCDFLSAPAGSGQRAAYVRALGREIDREAPLYADRSVSTIFFGGGTPSLLSAEEIAFLGGKLREAFRIEPDAEISMEMNPGTVTKEKLHAMKNAGVNRLSIGLQSTSDELLLKLGRIHTFAQFEESFHLARKQGFSNINIDIMSALPGQSVADYEETLKRVCAFVPEHISAYSLIVEEGTPFYERKEELLLPTEEEERRMYYLTGELLLENGYERYEISNYARAGYACRHNLAYWGRTDYLGLGIGASSFVDGVRYADTRDWKRYLTMEHMKEQIEPITKEDAMAEFMFLGLRRMAGVSANVFYREFGKTVESVYGKALKRLKEQRLLTMEGERIFLTDFGIDVSNYVFEQFLPE